MLPTLSRPRVEDSIQKVKTLILTLLTISTFAHAAPADLCLAKIRDSLKDPASARVESTLKWMNTPEGYAHHTLMVNAKNSFGGYAGAELYICLLTADEKKVVSVKRF